ncbi:MAG TPA: helix-hairpin-helix domain-containing protein [Acidobacteriota bacterium]|jgi:competence protein ComEA|nr:helix-hairpin-helix domain-containing protein [Acidobacteriota bacterium]
MKKVVTSFAIFMLVFLTCSQIVIAQSGQDQKTSGKVVNINTATQSELESLPGIGPSLAKKIIEFRQKNGGFKNPSDLMAVQGIGEKKFEQLKSLISVK